MNSPQKGLLPNGLRDALAPEAAHESELSRRMVSVFNSHGYDHVRPPLVEFEESLLGGPGNAVGGDMFRLMDPVSHRMMGLRPDITPQIARIATTRLVAATRPLRISYAGPILTVTGSELRPDREVLQVGLELIGSAALTADAEVVSVAAEALCAAGVIEPSFDLSMPQLVPLVCEGLGLGADVTAQARLALDRKDAGALSLLNGVAPETVDLLNAMVRTTGPASEALMALEALPLPPAAANLVHDLGTVISYVRDAAPKLHLTVDPVEFRGAAYQTGISFTIFAKGARGELGRGGRYPLNGESATGVTLFVDALRHVIMPQAATQSLYLPTTTTAADGARLRSEGWRTVRALSIGNARAEAMAQRCTHVFEDGEVQPLN